MRNIVVGFSVSHGGFLALKRYGFQLDRTVVAGCEKFAFGTDQYWECAMRQQTGPENHQAGSCKMGPANDPLAVVNQYLQVLEDLLSPQRYGHGVNVFRSMELIVYV